MAHPPRPNLFLSIAGMKCPACREHSVFTHPNAYDLKHVGDMPATCPVCGQDLRVEPGLCFGAAYVSYALMVGLMIITAAIFYLVMGGIGDYIWTFLGIATAVAILTTPLVFRYSRVIFLYICVKYKGVPSRR